MDGPFVDRMNQFVFKAALPVLLFEDLANSDFSHVWDTRFVLFCFGVTLIGIVLAACISMMLKDKGLRGEFIQASYRSSAALLGIAFIKNIYGNAGMAPLMIIGSVPLYNTMAVLILSFTRPGQGKMDGQVLLRTVRGVCTNPIILGILAGMLWSVTGIPQPAVMEKPCQAWRPWPLPWALWPWARPLTGKRPSGPWDRPSGRQPSNSWD